MSEYLTPKQVEAEFGIPLRTLEDWRYRSKREGRQIGPRWIKLGQHGRIRYRRKDLERWLTVNEVEAA